jgi:hypothetical protein
VVREKVLLENLPTLYVSMIVRLFCRLEQLGPFAERASISRFRVSVWCPNWNGAEQVIDYTQLVSKKQPKPKAEKS